MATIYCIPATRQIQPVGFLLFIGIVDFWSTLVYSSWASCVAAKLALRVILALSVSDVPKRGVTEWGRFAEKLELSFAPQDGLQCLNHGR